MKNDLFKKIKSATNAAKAGDAVLAFHYSENMTDISINQIDVVTDEKVLLPFNDRDFYGRKKVELWSPARGFKEVPLLETGSVCDALLELKLTQEDAKAYTHFIVKTLWTVGKPTQAPAGYTLIQIYRLNDLDRNQMVTGYF